MQGQLPSQLKFPTIRPRGYYTQFKDWPITPLSSNMYWQPDDIARFMININQGVMDPYRSHLQFTVATDTKTQPVGSYQIDSSAQSIISQTVISSNQVQVQRITQYDSLAAYLTDIGFSQFVCQGRDSQGLGYSNIPTTVVSSCNIPMTGSAPTPGGGSPGPITQNMQKHFVNPLYAATYCGKGPISAGNGNNNSLVQYNGQPTSFNNFVANQSYNSKTNNPTVPQFVAQTGRAMTIRAQYMASILNKDYPDTNKSYLQGAPIVKNQTWTYANMTNQGFNPDKAYQIDWPRSNYVPNNYDNTTATYTMGTYPTNCGLYGYQKAYCPQFAVGGNEATLSATVPTSQMKNGLITDKRMVLNQRTFRLPLISNICGILIPPQQFFLIPLQALNNLLLQLTLSKYAMFTSGYNDVHQLDSVGMSYMQRRLWSYTRIQWNLHIYTFPSQSVIMQINQSLTKSINVSCTGYALSSQFQLPNGGAVRNSWPVGAQYDSLCQVICLFLSNQYQTKSFCRKQFRLSNGINSMQLKVNTQFFPSQPIVGNAGNPVNVDSTGDNYPYYQMLLLSTNRLFNTNFPLPRINQMNFAINGRCYNTSNTNTCYDKAMYNTGTTYVWKQNSLNLDTAMGMSSFHQNRFIGRAAFIFTWQPYGHSKGYLTGISTIGVRNLDIMFNVVPVDQFPTDQTLLIFSRYNCIVRYTNQGILVYGK